ncbi:MAG: glycosyl hydrolase, partial [Bacteroidales bacterium]
MKKTLFLFQFVVFLGCNQIVEEKAYRYSYPFQNPELTVDDRINDLISKLSTDEKVSLMLYDSPAIERLGIPEYNWWNECLHGVGRAGKATVFPQAIALAATFDEE